MPADQKIKPTTELTGSKVNYYLTLVSHPQRDNQPAYQAECEDIIDSLKLTFDEANIFKELWRTANARLHNGKPGHNAVYGAEKVVHYAGRLLRQQKRAHENAQQNEQEEWQADFKAGLESRKQAS